MTRSSLVRGKTDGYKLMMEVVGKEVVMILLDERVVALLLGEVVTSRN